MKNHCLAFLLVILSIPIKSWAENSTDRYIELTGKVLEIESIAFSSESDEKILQAIKENVKDKLRDPESARFKDLKLIRLDNAIYACGEVNAKNAFGGYTGFKMFFASPISQFKSETDDFGPSIIAHFCLPYLGS